MSPEVVFDRLDDPVTGDTVANIEGIQPASVPAATALLGRRNTCLIEFLADIFELGFPVGVRLGY